MSEEVKKYRLWADFRMGTEGKLVLLPVGLSIGEEGWARGLIPFSWDMIERHETSHPSPAAAAPTEPEKRVRRFRHKSWKAGSYLEYVGDVCVREATVEADYERQVGRPDLAGAIDNVARGLWEELPAPGSPAPLSVEEARAKGVCRMCNFELRHDVDDNEQAHKTCLDRERATAAADSTGSFGRISPLPDKVIVESRPSVTDQSQKAKQYDSTGSGQEAKESQRLTPEEVSEIADEVTNGSLTDNDVRELFDQYVDERMAHEQAERELAEARQEIEELRRGYTVEIAEHHEEELAYTQQQLAAAHRETFREFKEYVHRRLDEMMVPHTFPDGVHSKEGCRIGDRLDWIEARLAAHEALRAAVAKLLSLLAQLPQPRLRTNETWPIEEWLIGQINDGAKICEAAAQPGSGKPLTDELERLRKELSHIKAQKGFQGYGCVHCDESFPDLPGAQVHDCTKSPQARRIRQQAERIGKGVSSIDFVLKHMVFSDETRDALHGLKLILQPTESLLTEPEKKTEE